MKLGMETGLGWNAGLPAFEIVARCLRRANFRRAGSRRPPSRRCTANPAASMHHAVVRTRRGRCRSGSTSSNPASAPPRSRSARPRARISKSPQDGPWRHPSRRWSKPRYGRASRGPAFALPRFGPRGATAILPSAPRPALPRHDAWPSGWRGRSHSARRGWIRAASRMWRREVRPNIAATMRPAWFSKARRLHIGCMPSMRGSVLRIRGGRTEAFRVRPGGCIRDLAPRKRMKATVQGICLLRIAAMLQMAIRLAAR